jgi:hypothetical protein
MRMLSEQNELATRDKIDININGQLNISTCKNTPNGLLINKCIKNITTRHGRGSALNRVKSHFAILVLVCRK